jgi:hypothetical protein
MQHVYVILLKGSGFTSTRTIIRGQSRLKIVFFNFSSQFSKTTKNIFFQYIYLEDRDEKLEEATINLTLYIQLYVQLLKL